MSTMTTPKVEARADLHYMGIRTQIPMRQLPQAIPQLTNEVFAWLDQHGIAPVGPPLIRYHVIDMANMLDVEMGVPIANGVQGNERVVAGVLPAGQYAALIYTGIENGVRANGALLDWGAQQGLTWDSWQTASGDAFGGRYESFLTGPEDNPDTAQWQTEVAIRLADAQAPDRKRAE